jgi:hypothetical protein
MDSVTAALLGSLVGAVAAVSGSVASNVVSLTVERRRQESVARQAYVQLVRDRCGVCFGQLFKVIQEIEWICWYAKHAPDEITAERIRAYEDRVNEAYSVLMSAIAMTASLSLSAYEHLRLRLAQLYKLEEAVGVSSRRMFTDRDAAIDELRRYADKAEAMRDELPAVLHEVMRRAEH